MNFAAFYCKFRVLVRFDVGIDEEAAKVMTMPD